MTNLSSILQQPREPNRSQVVQYKRLTKLIWRDAKLQRNTQFNKTSSIKEDSKFFLQTLAREVSTTPNLSQNISRNFIKIKKLYQNQNNEIKAKNENTKIYRTVDQRILSPILDQYENSKFLNRARYSNLFGEMSNYSETFKSLKQAQ